jgi:hypothetical protein
VNRAGRADWARRANRVRWACWARRVLGRGASRRSSAPQCTAGRALLCIGGSAEPPWRLLPSQRACPQGTPDGQAGAAETAIRRPQRRRDRFSSICARDRVRVRESSAPLHRPRPAARPAGPAGDAGHEPSLDLAPADPGPVRLARPRHLAASGGRPGPAARGDPHRPAHRTGNGRGRRRGHQGARRGPASLPRGASLVPAAASGARGDARGDRVLLHGVRGVRGAAELLGWVGCARG